MEVLLFIEYCLLWYLKCTYPIEIKCDYFVYIQSDCEEIQDFIHSATINCDLFLQRTLDFIVVKRTAKINIKLKSFNSQSFSLFLRRFAWIQYLGLLMSPWISTKFIQFRIAIIIESEINLSEVPWIEMWSKFQSTCRVSVKVSVFIALVY